MILISFLDFSNFSDRLRHFICQIPIYGFKDMNYSISNRKEKNKLLFYSRLLLVDHFIVIIQDYYYLSFLFTQILFGIQTMTS